MPEPPSTLFLCVFASSPSLSLASLFAPFAGALTFPAFFPGFAFPASSPAPAALGAGIPALNPGFTAPFCATPSLPPRPSTTAPVGLGAGIFGFGSVFPDAFVPSPARVPVVPWLI